MATERLVDAGLLFRQGVPPHVTYLFKHALVQDVAYNTLLRESRRALHARIAECLESQFAEMVESQPELLARHCTEAGLVEKGAALWGKAGQRSLGARRSLNLQSRSREHLAKSTPCLARQRRAASKLNFRLPHHPSDECQRTRRTRNQSGG